MKKLTPAFGIGIFVLSSAVTPLTAFANPFGGSSSGSVLESDSPSSPVPSLPQPVGPTNRMAVYRDCIDAHTELKGAEFEKVNKFCSCVADQTVQGDNSGLSNCAANGGSGGGGTLATIGEMAPTILGGVLDGLGSRRSSGSGILRRGGGIIEGLGGILGGGLGGGIGDIFK